LRVCGDGQLGSVVAQDARVIAAAIAPKILREENRVSVFTMPLLG